MRSGCIRYIRRLYEKSYALLITVLLIILINVIIVIIMIVFIFTTFVFQSVPKLA